MGFDYRLQMAIADKWIEVRLLAVELKLRNERAARIVLVARKMLAPCCPLS